MNTHTHLPEQAIRLFEKWSNEIEKISGDRQKIEYFQRELPGILKDKTFFIEIMEKIVKGSPFPDTRRSGLFENEVILYYKGVFSEP